MLLGSKVRPIGTIKTSPEDFVVEELPAYAASGEGGHAFVTFRKRGRNTADVARHLTEIAGVSPRDAGIAGMKDKVAVTTQTISVPVKEGDAATLERLRAAEIDGVEIIDVVRHGHKLKPGHLAGNRFTIVVRDLPEPSVTEVQDRLLALAEVGAPNAFGPQRFGRDGKNAERALEWLRGEARPPRDPKARRFAFSALQSRVFNDVLDARAALGPLHLPLGGDVLKKTDSGGLFVSEDLAADTERARQGEVVPTGPMPGAKMMRPQGESARIEDEVAARWLGGVDLEKARKLGEGTRRPLVLPVRELSVVAAEAPSSLLVRFVLPKGAFATTVLSCAIDLASPGIEGSRESPQLAAAP